MAVLGAGCSSSTPEPDEAALEVDAELNTGVTVCVGTSVKHAKGVTADLEVESEGEVIATAQVLVPGREVLRIPSTAQGPRVLVDGREWASSPRGGGWGVSRGEGCPTS